MKATYAVKWREPDGRTYLGRLALGAQTMRFEGRVQDGPAVNRQIAYREILGLRVGSRGTDRLDGQPSLVIERADGRYLATSAGAGVGIVQELADRVAGLRGGARRRATVVVPLQAGTSAAARELVAHRPPFDLPSTALTQHQLLLTEHEAIFVLEAQSEESLAALLGQLDIGSAAVGLRGLAAGPPRMAEVVDAWERPEPRLVPAAGHGL
jgi:hypothetical protein